MTESELIKNGFKKKTFDDEYWFELNTGSHKFITNDSSFNNRTDRWVVGYEKQKEMVEPFWFNNNLDNYSHFKTVFKILTGNEFKRKSK